MSKAKRTNLFPATFTVDELSRRLRIRKRSISSAIDQGIIKVGCLDVFRRHEIEPVISSDAAIVFAIDIGKSPNKLVA